MKTRARRYNNKKKRQYEQGKYREILDAANRNEISNYDDDWAFDPEDFCNIDHSYDRVDWGDLI